MTEPLDDVELLSNKAGEAYQRYLADGAPADVDEALSLVGRALTLARARSATTLPDLLINLSHLHLARFQREREPDDLAESFSALVEAVVLAPGDSRINARLGQVAPALLQVLDLGTAAGAARYVDLHRRLLARIDGDHLVIWANLAIGLRNLCAHTGAEEDLRALAEAAEHAAGLAPEGSPAAVMNWEYAAEVRLYLAARQRDAADARRAAVAYQALGRHRPADASEREDEFVHSALAPVLAYEISGEATDRDDALAALETLTAGGAGLPAGLSMSAQDVLSSLFLRYRDSGDRAVLDAATRFAAWCVARMDERSDVRFSTLPELLNSLAVLMAESSDPDRPRSGPLPWNGDPDSERQLRLPGLAEAFGRRQPFHRGPPLVSGPVGKIYLEVELPVVAARWQPSRSSPLAGHAVSRFESAHALPPQSGQGAAPVFVPARIHLVTVTLTAPDDRAVTVEDVRVLLDAREPVGRETVDVVLSSGALPTPDLNVFLDFEPPLCLPDPTPLEIAQGGSRAFTVRAITEGHVVRWRLLLDWRCGRRTGTLTVPLQTSGDSGFRTFGPGGEVRPVPGYALGFRPTASR